VLFEAAVNEILEGGDTLNLTASRPITPSQSAPEKMKKKRTNWTFNRMAGSTNMQAIFYNDQGEEMDSAAQKRQQQHQKSIQEAIVVAENNPAKRRKLVEEQLNEKSLDGVVIEALFVQ